MDFASDDSNDEHVDEPASAGSCKSAVRYHLRRGAHEVDVPIGDFIIGRAPECDLRLSGGLVSRKHARLRCTDHELVVCDLSSRNGVLVNQRTIHEPTRLAHADRLGIGLETFEVIDEQVRQHPAHLSTLPPPQMATRAAPTPAPPGESDVDAPERHSTVTARVNVLTDREREVLEQIVLGYTQREIALRLFVSVKTIETHRARIAEKLGCETRAELVSYAISAGLLGNSLRASAGLRGKP